MTLEQKDILISRMLECPAELSDSEITQILADDELRDIYSISVDIKAAKRNQAEIDASAEWKRFMPKLVRPRRWNSTILARAAAILVGVLFVSAAIFFMTNRDSETEAPLYAENDDTGDQNINVTEIQPTDTTTVQGGQGSLLSKATSSITSLHKSTAGKKSAYLDNAGKMPARLEDQTVDVEEYVRIQQARMDNDLAVQQAEAMVNQYYAMADINEVIQSSSLGDGYPMDDEILTLIIP